MNGKATKWVMSQDIEQVVGIRDDEMNLFLNKKDRFSSCEYVWDASRDGFVLMVDGMVATDRGNVVVIPRDIIESAVRRGTMRPDVAIIETKNKAWKITGQ